MIPPEQSAAEQTATVQAKPDPSSSSDHCRFFIPKKKRYCNWPRKKGHDYCGNHLFEGSGVGEARVPCPANPKHDVPVSQLFSHVPKCPDAVYHKAMRAQPYFSENTNAGADTAYGLQQLQDRVRAAAAAADAAAADAQAAAAARGAKGPLVPPEGMSPEAAAAAAASYAGLIPAGPQAAAIAAVAAEAAAPFHKGVAAVRQAAAVALGPLGFAALLHKIKAAHEVLSAAHPVHSSKLKSTEDTDALREQCRAFDPLITFDAKHALQNASIVGNMCAAGLLQDPCSTVCMELGAGKAWLSAWLHMLHPDTKEFVLLDRLGNFANKADRRLRHLNVTRVAVDLKDAALLPLLQLHMAPPAVVVSRSSSSLAEYSGITHHHASNVGNKSRNAVSMPQDVVVVNHGGLVRLPKRLKPAEAVVAVETSHPACGLESSGQQELHVRQQQQQQQQQHGRLSVPWVVTGKHLCGAATDFALRGCLNALTQQQQQQQHQQQQQQHTPEQHEPQHEPQQQQQQQQQQLSEKGGLQFDLQGLAIATCCHHRCGWMSYTGREALQAKAGITKDDFEVIAWLTGWALCGHEAAPGAAQGGAEGDTEAFVGAAASNSLPDAAQAGVEGNAGACGGDPASSNVPGAATQPVSQKRAQQAAAVFTDAVADSGGARDVVGSPKGLVSNGCSDVGGSGSAMPQQHKEAAAAAAAAVTPWHPANTLSAEERIQLGLRCKQLLDAGRCAWLQKKLAPLLQQAQRQQQKLLQQERIPPQLEQAGAAGVQGVVELYVQRVAYVDEAVSGENTLLVLGRRLH